MFSLLWLTAQKKKKAIIIKKHLGAITSTYITIIDDITDHFPTYISISSSDDINNDSTFKYRDMKNFNSEKFLCDLESNVSNIRHCLNNGVCRITKSQYR